MRVIFKSRILDAAQGLCTRVRNLFSRSWLLWQLSTLYPRLERRFSRGRFGLFTNTERDRNTWQYRTQRCAQKKFEKSFFLCLWKGVVRFFLKTSTGTLGSLGILLGGFSSVLWLVREPPRRSEGELIAYLILAVVSVTLLPSRRAIGRDLEKSGTVGAFLLKFCGLSIGVAATTDGRDRHWLSLLIAFVTSSACIWISPVYLWGSFAMLLLLILLFTVPELCTVATLLVLPFLNWLPHPTGILAVLSVLSLVTWLWKVITGRRRFSFGVIDACVALSVVSTLLGGTSGGASAASAVTASAMILFYFPVRNLSIGGVWQKRAMGAIRLSGATVGLVAVLQYVMGKAELRWVDTARFSDIGGRAVGCFSNPNILAVYLLLVAPFLLGAVLEQTRSGWGRAVCMLGFFTVLGGIIVTWSRGAWLGFLLQTALFFAAYSRRSAGGLLLSLVPLSVGVGFLPHSIVNRFSSIGSLAESSIRYRLYTWRGVLRMIADHPWGIGVGNDVFLRVYPKYAVSGAEGAVHTHQIFLRVMSEMGLGGLLIFLLLLVLLFVCFAYALGVETRGRRQSALTAACAILGVLVMGFFDDVWYHFGMLCMFFAVCAMLVSAGDGGEVLW